MEGEEDAAFVFPEDFDRPPFALDVAAAAVVVAAMPNEDEHRRFHHRHNHYREAESSSSSASRPRPDFQKSRMRHNAGSRASAIVSPTVATSGFRRWTTLDWPDDDDDVSGAAGELSGGGLGSPPAGACRLLLGSTVDATEAESWNTRIANLGVEEVGGDLADVTFAVTSSDNIDNHVKDVKFPVQKR